MINEALVESVFKDIPRLPYSRISVVSSKFQISDVKDFNPHGDSAGDSLPWGVISQAVLFRDNYSCRVCERSRLTQVSADTKFDKIHLNVQVHHITPRKDGGKDNFENLITLCEECHRKTFSTGYSGIPVSGQSTIYNFDFKINLCIQQGWVYTSKLEEKRGFLNDYWKVIDAEENKYKVIPATGHKVRVSFIQVTRELYAKTVKDVEKDMRVTDYTTVRISSESGHLTARVLLGYNAEFLI